MPVQTLTLEALRISDYKIIVIDPADLNSNRTLDNGPGSGVVRALDVSSFCQSISWSYDVDQPVETYTLKFVRARDIIHILHQGVRIFIHAWQPYADTGLRYDVLKAGIIWDVTNDTTEGGNMTVIAHDVMIYLTQNKGSNRLQINEKASDFIKRLLPKYGIPFTEIADTQIKLGPMGGELFINRTLFDMIATVLQYTRDLAFQARFEATQNINLSASAVSNINQYGPLRFILRTKNGKLTVVEKREPHYGWKFESGDLIAGKPGNVIAASNKWTLDSYRNVVKIYNRASPDIIQAAGGVQVTDMGDPLIYASSPPENPPGSGNFSDPDGSIKKYGLLAESIDFTAPSETGATLPDMVSQAQWQAVDMLRRLKIVWQTGTITSFNINTLQAGDVIFVDIPQIGMIGKFYIKSGQHTVTASESQMVLTVNFQDFLPFVYRSQHEAMTNTIQFGT